MAPLPGETYFQALEPYPYVSTGIPFFEACLHHAVDTFGAERIYVIVSTSISITANFTRLKTALGTRIIGVRYGIRQHVPWDDVVEVAQELVDLDADLVVTLGAGSLTDAAKVATLAAANDALTIDALEKLRGKDSAAIRPVTIPTINIPTSLAGGEYNPHAGATDLRIHRKAGFTHPSMVARLVILDPALTISTPARVWLSSGVRAVDHCVEGLCSPFFREDAGQTEANQTASKKQEIENIFLDGLAKLLPSLLTTKTYPTDLDARRNEMLGVLDSMRGLLLGNVQVGASHGIGHQLGPLGVGHGETSCVMLPAVLRWNLERGDDFVRRRQQLVLQAFWAHQTVSELLKAGGLDQGTATAGEVVRTYVASLGMPTTLQDVGIRREWLDKLAENSMTDRNISTNPVPIAGAAQVKEILNLAMDGQRTESR